MGTYYKAVCEELREFIDPGKTGDSGRKFIDVVKGPTANVVAHAMMTRWRGKLVRYVADVGGPEGWLYEEATERPEAPDEPWKNVTAEVLAAMTKSDDDEEEEEPS